MNRSSRLRSLGALGLFVCATAVLPASADGPLDVGAKARDLTLGLDLDDARRLLDVAAKAAPTSIEVALERVRLAIYDGDCDAALAILARPELQKLEVGAALAEISGGCARVTAATHIERDDARGIEIRYQDDEDRALTPVLVETIVAAREALTRDLGVTWPKTTRFVVVRDLLSLSAMTGLPYDAARTTGTVGVAKWGRVTLLSPRASLHGYAWRDTVAHELTHMAITRASLDRAPLWLQEGLAKREEVRWRPPGPFDDRPSPESLVLRGMELKLDLPLDKLGPSIAMLPTADAALVAFAEVTSFVRFLAESGPPNVLPKLLTELRTAKGADEALVAASGRDLKTWDGTWRTWLAAKPKDSIPPGFGLGAAPPNLSELRERARLAELLLGREHPAAALAELRKLPAAAGQDDPVLRTLWGRAHAGLGQSKEAEAVTRDPKELLASYGPWWALRGTLLRGSGVLGDADAAFVEAVAQDPIDIDAACEGGVELPRPEKRLLCDAARRRGPQGD
ncbi:MAG: hypothetical protein IPG50_25530 [Myxococcales bacterium]|nr:hypothetical protein [Myxococcales bacterium]